MYEPNPQRLRAAFAAVLTDPPVQHWTVANAEDLALQALALLERAGVPLPSGTMEEFVSLRIPSRRSPVATVFSPWTTREQQARLAAGAAANLGEIRLGDNCYPGEFLRLYPNLTGNQQRLFQLRCLIHEFFHTLDFRDVVRLTGGDHDAAIALQGQQVGFGRNLPGYARNEICTDARTALVLARNGLLFHELRLSLDEYRADWDAQGPVSEQVFANLLITLGRTPFP